MVFGIFVTFVKPLSLLSFSDLLCLPVSLPRFVILVIFAVIVIFGIFDPSVKPLSLLFFNDLLCLQDCILDEILLSFQKEQPMEISVIPSSYWVTLENPLSTMRNI